MKAYVLTTGIVFGLVIASHIARVAVEGPLLLKEPSFVLTSLLAIGLAAWAWRVFRRFSREARNPRAASLLRGDE